VIAGGEVVDAGECQMKKIAITRARTIMIAIMRENFLLKGNFKEGGVTG